MAHRLCRGTIKKAHTHTHTHTNNADEFTLKIFLRLSSLSVSLFLKFPDWVIFLRLTIKVDDLCLSGPPTPREHATDCATTATTVLVIQWKISQYLFLHHHCLR